MMHDDELRSSIDYTKGQKDAAHRIFVELINLFNDKKIVIEMTEKLADKFASENHAGPTDVANFMDLADEEEIEMIKRDAYEQIQALISLI